MNQSALAPTTEARRRLGDSLHWIMFHTSDGLSEQWERGNSAVILPDRPDASPFVKGYWREITPFMVAMGAQIPGYRIIPEETAQRAAGYARMKGANFYDVPSVRDQAYQDAETLWPSAAPHQIPIQDQATAVQAERGPAVPGDGPGEPRPSEKGGPSPSPLLHPDGQALLNMVQTGLDSYDTPRITRELQEFFADGEADEPREEETP